MRLLVFAAVLVSGCSAISPSYWYIAAGLAATGAGVLVERHRTTQDQQEMAKYAAEVKAEREAKEAAAAEERRRAAAEATAAAAQREEQRAETKRTAAEHGYKGIVFDSSLAQAIAGMIKGGISVDDLTGFVIVLNENEDYQFTAFQILPAGALYTNDYSTILLRNCRETLVERSPLTALRNYYVAFKGVTSYSTILGSRQAFVIEPAW